MSISMSTKDMRSSLSLEIGKCLEILGDEFTDRDRLLLSTIFLMLQRARFEASIKLFDAERAWNSSKTDGSSDDCKYQLRLHYFDCKGSWEISLIHISAMKEILSKHVSMEVKERDFSDD